MDAPNIVMTKYFRVDVKKGALSPAKIYPLIWVNRDGEMDLEQIETLLKQDPDDTVSKS